MRHTVRARLLRLVTLLMLPSLAIAALLAWRVYVTARRGAEDALREAARGLDQLVDREFVQAETLLHILAATSELQRDDLAGFDRLARDTLVMGGEVVLVDASGQDLVDTSRPAGAPPRREGVPAGWDAEATGQTSIHPVTRNPTSPGFQVQIVLPLGAAGRHVYDLKLVVPTTSLQAILTRQALPDGWVSSVMDVAGTLAGRTRDSDRFVGRRAGRDLLAGMALSDEGARDATAVDGSRVLIAFSRSPKSHWTVSVAAPLALVSQTGWHSTVLVAVLGSLAIVGGVAGALGVARTISRPIEALADRARALGEGEEWKPTPPGLAEVDSVSQAMRAASAALIEREQALRELNAGLTERVAARTRELADALDRLEIQRGGLEAILDQMPAGVTVHHRDGGLVLINREARRLLGAPPPAAARPGAEVGLEPAAGCWPELRQGGQSLPPSHTPTARALEGFATERTLLSVNAAEGRRIDLEVSARPLRDRNGKVTDAVTILNDVTARLEAEEMRRRSQRLEAVGQLTGGVAHEFNNLLLAIGGCLDLLAKPIGALGDPRSTALMANATRASGRGSRLTTQLLAFARRQTLQIESLELNELVSGMKELLEGTLGRAVLVEVVARPALWPALADAAQVELLLLNLAINARDAMPGGGTLTISTGSVTTGSPSRAEDPPEGDHAVLRVTDTGHGMSADVLARVFEPFFTTKEVGRGSGLGLPQVLGVAQQMGGGVTIASRPGMGTTVSVFLPRAHEPAMPAPLAAELAEIPMLVTGRLRGRRVLVVDDDPDVLAVTRALLVELGAEVADAASGGAALAALRAGEFELVLADLTMPHMTGLELAAEIAERLPGLPVVLMTGYGPEALANPGPHIRASLQKPFRAGVLARVLAGALGF